MEVIDIFGLGSDLGEKKLLVYGGVLLNPFVNPLGEPYSFQPGEFPKDVTENGELCVVGPRGGAST